MDTANAPIGLADTEIEMVIDGRAVRMVAKPSLRLLPSPSSLIEFSGAYEGIGGAISRSVKIAPSGKRLQLFSPSSTVKDGTISGTLVPLRQPITVSGNTRQRLALVEARLINFPPFFGTQDRMVEIRKGHRRRLGVVSLSAGPWQVEVMAVPNIDELVQELKASGGFAITHSVKVARQDKGTFPSKDAEFVLEAMRLFLSFARGAFCSLTLPVGSNRIGEKVWEQWGAHIVVPWMYTPSWFDTMHGEALVDVLPGYWRRFVDDAWRDTLRTVLYWYLRSNTHGQGVGVDGGLILSQAALERLAYAVTGRTGKSAAHRIREALVALRIPSGIPRACKNLRRLGRTEGWSDGPEALTSVRNSLVHPIRRHANRPSPFSDAWNLAQRYVEVMLLKLFGYKGLHGNRLTQKWRGQVVRVPR